MGHGCHTCDCPNGCECVKENMSNYDSDPDYLERNAWKKPDQLCKGLHDWELRAWIDAATKELEFRQIQKQKERILKERQEKYEAAKKKAMDAFHASYKDEE